jgi:GMP synthase (glutamine-hydrolysing)
MKTALAIMHVAFEDLGTLGPALEDAGYTVRTLDACTSELGRAQIAESDLLIVLGGPIGVYDREAYPFLDAELELLRNRLAKKQPVIGICLGAQLLAAACGAAVYAGKRGKEIGWGAIRPASDAALYPEFTALFDLNVHVLHWHGDTFDLPKNARLLASTDLYPNQAFAIERYALGLQFHPEVTALGLERWYVGHACELGAVRISAQHLRRDAARFAPALETAAGKFWKAWLENL